MFFPKMLSSESGNEEYKYVDPLDLKSPLKQQKLSPKKLLLQLVEIGRSMPAFKTLMAQAENMAEKYEKSSPKQRTFTALNLVILSVLLRKNHVLGTQVLVVYLSFVNSLKTIETPTRLDYERWLTFWPLFGISTMADWYARNKAYHLGKVLFFYWLSQNGGSVIYRSVLKRFLASL